MVRKKMCRKANQYPDPRALEGTSRDSDSGAGILVREGEGSSENRGHSPYFECCEDTYRHACGTMRGSWRLVGSTHASRLRGRRPEKQDGASSWRMETRDGALESYSL